MRANSINVFSPRFNHIKGKEAWRNNLRLTAMAADRISSSLGPNGAYKMVTYNRGPEKILKVTKDGIAVLQELAIQYPTLVVLSEASKIQRQETGDGVKSFAILTAELLKRADKLSSKGVHKSRILKGYQEAARKAMEVIKAISKPLSSNEFNSVLDSLDCGKGYLTPEIREMLLEATSIAKIDGRIDNERIRVVRKPGGTQLETALVKGLVVKKGKAHPNMPNVVNSPRIVLTSARIGNNRLEIKMPGQGPFHMNFSMTDPENLTGFKNAEKQRKICALEKLEDFQANVLFCQQPIDSISMSNLLKMGVLAFSSVDKSDLYLISRATGAKVIGDIANLEKSDVGNAELLETDKVGLEELVIIHGSSFATFFVRGSTAQTLDELETLVGNSARLLQLAEKSMKTVAGGGASEFEVAHELKKYSLKFAGREQLAIAEFAEALMEIPRRLAINNGLNPDDALAQIAKLHLEGNTDCGLLNDGSCGKACNDLSEVKLAIIQRAFEVASLLLRIDEQIIAKEIPKFHRK